MNIKKQLSRATSLFDQGNIDEADKLSRNLLKAKPNHLAILVLRGAVLIKLQEYDRAKHVLEKAFSKNNNNPDIINNLATAYINLGLNNEAITLLKKGIAKNDTISSFYSNIGVAFYNLNKIVEAEKSYKQALQLNNNLLEAKFNHAVCLRKLGFLRESLSEFLEINDSDPLLSAVYFHLSEILLLLHSTEDAEQVLDTGLAISSSSVIEQFHALTTKALLTWITGRISLSHDYIEKTRELTIPPSAKTKGYAEANAFNVCISELLVLRSKFEYLYSGNPAKPIFFVSESHCLSPSEVIVSYNNSECRILSLMIRGCKAYHLGNSENNQYKSSMIALFDALPDNSIVTIAFGEIDCRIDEGIFVAQKNKEINYKKSLPVFIKSYVAYCIDLAKSHNHEIIFCGVPPLSNNLDYDIDQSDHELLSSIIVTFNDILKKCSKDHAVSFLDIYNAICDEQGIRKDEFDLDGIHLHPKTFGLAFSSYLFT